MSQAFCTECGAKLVPQARFCTGCGAPAGGGPAAGLRLRMPLGRYGPTLVLACLVVGSGLAIWLGTLAAKPPPRIPGQSPGASGSSLPEGHPPLEVPAELEKRIQELEQRTSANAEDVEAWKDLGRALYKAAEVDPRRLAAAASACDRVLARDPKDSEALRVRGNIAFDARQPREAIDFYQRYLALSPDDLSVMTDMATMHLTAGDTAKAIEVYQKVLARDPKFFQAHLNVAVAYRKAGRHEDEQAALRKALELAPDEFTRGKLAEILAAPDPTPRKTPRERSTGTFREAVESVFRQHSMVGEKVERIEWPAEMAARVTLRDFPMATMPPIAREAFSGWIKEELKATKEGHQVAAELRVEFVDSATGKVMETVVQ